MFTWKSFCLFIVLAMCAVFVSSSELVPGSFKTEVIESDKTWLVEFYSPMCGSCQEFTPTWNKIDKAFKQSVNLGKINIDDKEGMKVAQDMGVLDEGIPSLRLFSKVGDGKGKSIKIDESLKNQYKNSVNAMKKNTKDLTLGENGIYLKAK